MLSTHHTKILNRGRRGSTMVEFALAFLVFLGLLVSLFKFGGLAWTYTAVHYASRQASRFPRAFP